MRIHRSDAPDPDLVTVIVPVLNERDRLALCLDGLLDQPDTVAGILVVDGGSEDGTQELVRQFMSRDPRLNLIDAAPVPHGINGKAYGLQLGLEHALPESRWILTVDADVRPAASLVRSLLAHARTSGVLALSVAAHQRLSGLAEGVVHPSLLASFVYRFGVPGHATDETSAIQANGQCFLIERETLERVGGFTWILDSVCEDVTLARDLANAGYRVGFYESESLIETAMYDGWRDAWANWPRSLPMWDRHAGWRSVLGYGEVLLVQALPLPLTMAFGMTGHRGGAWLVNVVLSFVRIGTLAGMARAYRGKPWTYWLSPVADLAVALQLILSALRRSHTWRGRPVRRDGGGPVRDGELG
ncbi:MAG TPA: glycosyltransferase family 2 protein [Thermomicrobiales bacterium]|nr:glycosyltransferase family 2 protein [Thermomicrobiales bacterium]